MAFGLATITGYIYSWASGKFHVHFCLPIDSTFRIVPEQKTLKTGEFIMAR